MFRANGKANARQIAVVCIALLLVVAACTSDAATTTTTTAPPSTTTTTTSTTTTTTQPPTTTSTTTAPTTTTTTLSPQQHFAARFAEALTGDSVVDAASSMTKVFNRARDFVEFMSDAAIGSSSATQSDEGIDVCMEMGAGTYCTVLSDFRLDGEQAIEFAVSGMDPRSVLYGPYPRHPDPDAGNDWCFYRTTSGCDFSNPRMDRELYLSLKWVLADPGGSVIVVFEFITGERDLDIRVDSTDQFLTSLTLGGVETKADQCWSDSAEDEFSSLGLRILKGQLALMTCRWDTVRLRGADLERGAELELFFNFHNNAKTEFGTALDPALAEYGPVLVSSLDVGDCFDEPEGGMAQLINCESPHDIEAFFEFSLPADDFPDDVGSAAAEGCLPEFEGFVGIPLEQSSLDLFTLLPTEVSWAEGSRTVICGVRAGDGSRLEGSMRVTNS